MTEAKYELVKVLIGSAPEPSNSGKTGTPIIGYVLKDLSTGIIEAFNRHDACTAISVSGAINVEAKTREFQGKTIYYLKPTDDKKINEYMLNIGV